MTYVAVAVLIPVGAGESPSGVLDSFSRQALTPDKTLFAAEIIGDGATGHDIERVFQTLAVAQRRALQEREEALTGKPAGEPASVEAEDPQM